MKKELFEIAQFTVYGYGMMIAIGVLVSYLVAKYRAKKMKMDYNRVSNLAIWSLIGGLLGAKLLYYITQLQAIIADPKLLLNISGGFVVYGGILGGILAGFLYCRKAKLNFLQYFDLMIPSVALAQGFGRIGCFFAGCCYGLETSSPFGIIFHDSDFAPNGIRLIPTQLISSGLDFLNFFVLIVLAKRKKADGQIAALYLIFYSVGRFVLEFFRGDLIRGNIGSVTTSQFISIFLFAAGCVLFFVRAFQAKRIKSTYML